MTDSSPKQPRSAWKRGARKSESGQNAKAVSSHSHSKAHVQSICVRFVAEQVLGQRSAGRHDFSNCVVQVTCRDLERLLGEARFEGSNDVDSLELVEVMRQRIGVIGSDVEVRFCHASDTEHPAKHPRDAEPSDYGQDAERDGQPGRLVDQSPQDRDDPRWNSDPPHGSLKMVECHGFSQGTRVSKLCWGQVYVFQIWWALDLRYVCNSAHQI